MFWRESGDGGSLICRRKSGARHEKKVENAKHEEISSSWPAKALFSQSGEGLRFERARRNPSDSLSVFESGQDGAVPKFSSSKAVDTGR